MTTDTPQKKKNKPFRRHRAKGEGFWAQHYIRETEHYVLEGYFYSPRRLIITFEHASENPNRADIYRYGWGSKRFRAQRVSHLCVKPKSSDWYRNPDLADALSSLRENGFFDQFETIITYGGSMGGYAALTYADLVKATTVLALNPQTTLNLSDVPWEDRFQEAQLQDWTGPYSDAVGKSENAKQVLCVYDPFTRRDAMHVARLNQSNLVHVRAPFLGHGIGEPLNELGALWRLVTWAKDDAIDLPCFHKVLRDRKKLPRYLEILGRQPRVQKSRKMTAIVLKAMKELPQDAE